MNRFYLFFTLIFFALTSIGCTTSDESDLDDGPCKQSTGTIKIMPLGASRVQGFRPYFESYRYPLWKELVNENWSIDFVGTQKDISIYEAFGGFCFDSDHEGRSGWTAERINNNLEGWLEITEKPDIVLFSSPGGNDALQGIPLSEIIPNINAIIDKLQAYNPNIIILIEQLAPGKTSFMDAELTASFNQIHDLIEDIANTQTNTTSLVVPVDMATGFKDDFLADNIHYNLQGAQFIAQRYYDKLVPYLTQ